MDLYKNILRPILFKLNPEDIHDLSFKFLNLFKSLNIRQHSCYDVKFQKQVMGLNFPNPIGLAAGFDKNAQLLDVIELFGFGFIEVGTITPKPQTGNPRPRLFRFPESESILNFMGFNNDGVEKINKRLENRKSSSIIVGANIGKNKFTELSEAPNDYSFCIRELYNNVDYFTLNISSPNTPQLRDLLDLRYLRILLDSVQNQNHKNPITRPIVVKISPDMSEEKLIGVIEMCVDFKISAIISTNTTTDHDYFKGGLSGKPLKTKSVDILKIITKHIDKRMSVISSGGIINEVDGIERFELGSDLIQLYTGLIYDGPFLPKKILKKYELKFS